MNILQRGTAWIGQHLKASVSVEIVYMRRNVSVTLSATVTTHEYEIVDEEDITTIARSRDYILHAADLAAGGIEIPPRAGDRIQEDVGGESQTFEVLPAGMRNEYESLDTDDVLYMVYTKRVA